MNRPLNLDTEILFQVISHASGTRTPPARTTFGELREFAQQKMDEGFAVDESDTHDYFKDFILIVSDNADGEFLVSDFPLFRIEHFVQATNFLKNQSAELGQLERESKEIRDRILSITKDEVQS